MDFGQKVVLEDSCLYEVSVFYFVLTDFILTGFLSGYIFLFYSRLQSKEESIFLLASQMGSQDLVM